MDFALDKYDLFNAPQYVDFNEFIRNDGYGNDNADDFFRHHREEDDFFPNENLSPTALLLQDEQAYQLNEEPEMKVEMNKAITQPLTVKNQAPEIAKSVSTKYVEIDYEEELRLAEEANEKARKIAEIEEIERQKILAKLEEASKSAEIAELLMSKTQLEHSAKAEVSRDQPEENPSGKQSDSNLRKPSGNMEDKVKSDNHECVEVESNTRPPMEAEIQDVEAASDKYEIAMGSNCDEGHVKQFQGGDGADTKCVGDFPAQKELTEQKSKNQIPVLIKGHATPVPKKSTLKVTIPQPFKFAELRPRKIQETNTEQFRFKAKPAPLKILKGDTVQVVKPPPKVTQPVEMHFASDDRIRERNFKLRKSVQVASVATETTRKSKHCLFGSRSNTDSTSSVDKVDASTTTNNRSRSPTKTIKPQIRPRSLSADRSRPTLVQPFSFEERNKELQRKKEEKIRNALKEDMKLKEFHAHPVPKFARRLPPKHPAPITAVKPFRFQSDERGHSYNQEFQRKVEEEMRSLKQQAEFTAQPNTVIYRKPFEPEKSNVPLAEPFDVVLHTDRRAPERSRYDLMIKEKEAELEEIRRKEQLMKEEQEKQLCASLRQMSVHKAKPAPKNRMFELKMTEKALTEPISPAFALLPSQRRMKCSENKENLN